MNRFNNSIITGFFVLFFAFNSKAQTTLEDEDKALSNQFKALSAADRDTLFTKHLFKVVRVTNSSSGDTTSSNLMGSKVSTRDDVRMLLGNPTNVIPDAIDEWNLLPFPSLKKVVFVYNRFNQVVNWSIKN